MRIESRSERQMHALAAAGVALTALSLRSGVTSVGAELVAVRRGLGMDGTAAGLLTALPVLCFAAFGALVPVAARRARPATLVVAGLVADVAGLAGRAVTASSAAFLTASLLALAGIAVANVMLPVLIKRYFPDRIGVMTGVFSMCVAIGIGIPAAVTVPIGAATGLDWRGGLAFWAAPAALAVLPWVLLLLGRTRHQDDPGSQAPQGGPQPVATRPSGRATRLRLVRNPTAVALATFFGMQSLGAYAVMGWLPKIYHDAGLSPQTSGLLLALTVVLAIPIGLVLPPFATRRGDQGALVIAIAVAALAGYVILILSPTGLPWLAAVLLTAAHCGFPLAITMISLRAREPATAARLSGFVQSAGYAMAAAGPVAIGMLHEATGGWTMPISVLVGCTVLQLVTGLIAARPGQVDDDLTVVPTPADTGGLTR